MKDDVLAHLYDILHAAHSVKQFVAGSAFDHYCSNELLRSAVERKFEIMGEALNKIDRDDPGLLSRIRDYRDIISFRNILAWSTDTMPSTTASSGVLSRRISTA